MYDASLGHNTDAASVSFFWISVKWSHLVQLSAFKGFPTNRPNTIWEQTTQGLERRFVWEQNKRKLDVHKINSINSYAEKGKKQKSSIYTLYRKLNSTAKIKSTSKDKFIKNKANQLKSFSSDRRKEKKQFDVLQTKNHWQRIKLRWQQQHWKKTPKNRLTAPFPVKQILLSDCVSILFDFPHCFC